LFVPWAPARVLDTRFGPSPQPAGIPVWAGGAIELDGGSGADGEALLANVTSTEPLAGGFVVGWAAGTPRPPTSLVNAAGPGPFGTVANLAIVERSNRGVVFGSAAGEHLVVDLAGRFVGAPRTATLPAAVNLPPGTDGAAERFGASRQGRALLVERRTGSATPSRRVVVVGAIHGDEPGGLAVLDALRSGPLPGDLDLWLVGSLNPDGSAAGQRGNAAGVDLNRNFPSGWLPAGASPYTTGAEDPGAWPASEPETQSFMTLARSIAFAHGPVDAVLWYHQPWGAVVCAPGDRGCEQLAARVGMAVLDEPRPGSAMTWSTDGLGARSSAVVELPFGWPSAATVATHADAVRRYGTT